MRIDSKEEKECSGCTACLNVCPVKAITMKPNNEGFLYPIIDQKKCINCGLCKKVCPFTEKWFEDNKNKKPKVYAIKNSNDAIRINSTSGGVFSLIAEYILNHGGVVYGVALEQKNVKHIRITSLKELYKLRGSKYVQSELNDCFKNIKKDLDDSKSVLFSGTPCQNAGLKSFLGKEYGNLYMIDIICHGVPSPRVFKDHISMIEKKYNRQIIDYHFRSKIKGWHKHLESVFFSENEEKYKDDYIQAYKYLYAEHSILRKSCNNCHFTKINRVSDLTLGDFWGIEKHYKDFDDNKGVSLLLINSEKGENIFQKICTNSSFIESDIEKCQQSNLNHPTKISPKRDSFWKEYNNNGYEYIIKKYSSINPKVKIINFLKVLFPNNFRKKIKKILNR